MRLPPCSSFPALATGHKISRACHSLCADSLLDWFIEPLPTVEPTEGDWGWFKSVEGRNFERAQDVLGILLSRTALPAMFKVKGESDVHVTESEVLAYP